VRRVPAPGGPPLPPAEGGEERVVGAAADRPASGLHPSAAGGSPKPDE